VSVRKADLDREKEEEKESEGTGASRKRVARRGNVEGSWIGGGYMWISAGRDENFRVAESRRTSPRVELPRTGPITNRALIKNILP